MAPRTKSLPAGPGPLPAAERDLEQYRRELTGYCYRMLGSGFEAEDAVQETMVRAWRNLDSFEGRAAFRSWLYRIATNVCLDMQRGPQRRARPMDLAAPSSADRPPGAPLPERTWVLPMADHKIVATDGDPAEVAAERESVRLAFVAALQHLPPRQRAVLILREVLRWRAAEVAELLDSSVASVNSALQRARAALAAQDLGTAPLVIDAQQQEMLARYVDAFERYDIPSLVALLRDDAVMTMPPLALWLQGAGEMAKWYLGHGIGCQGSRLVPVDVNGCPGFGSYRPGEPGVHTPWAIQVIEFDGHSIGAIHHFVYPELFGAFGLPERLVA